MGNVNIKKEQIKEFQTVKFIRLIAEQDVSLPLEDTIKNFLEYAGLKVVGSDTSIYDATLTIKLYGTALKKSYYGIGDHSYSGARLHIEISFYIKNNLIYQNIINKEILPPSIIFESYINPSDAPFIEVFNDFLLDFAKIMGELFGPKVLIAALKDANKNIVMGAVYAIKYNDEIGNLKAEAIDTLITLLDDSNSIVRLNVARTLDKLGWKPISDKEKVFYYIAIKEWGKCTEIGKPAINQVIAFLNDLDYDVKIGAVTTLGLIGDKSVVKLLKKMKWNDKNKNVRKVIKETLIKLKKKT